MTGQVDFGTCIVKMKGPFCKTVFPDGKFCVGTTSVNEPDQIQSAKNMGYPETEFGVIQMLCMHELMHNFVCQKMGDKYSFVHRIIAEKGVENLSERELEICKEEERITGAFQTIWQSGKWTDGVTPLLEISGKDIETLKKEFTDEVLMKINQLEEPI